MFPQHNSSNSNVARYRICTRIERGFEAVYSLIFPREYMCIRQESSNFEVGRPGDKRNGRHGDAPLPSGLSDGPLFRVRTGSATPFPVPPLPPASGILCLHWHLSESFPHVAQTSTTYTSVCLSATTPSLLFAARLSDCCSFRRCVLLPHPFRLVFGSSRLFRTGGTRARRKGFVE